MLGRSALIAVFVFATVVAANHPLPIPRVEDLPPRVQSRADDVNYRLPNNTRPISYNVHLTTHIHTQTNFNFSGEVSILLVAVNASRTITLHQRQLSIGNARLVLENDQSQPIALNSVSEYNAVNEFLTFTLTSGELVVGNRYILTIAFNGNHRQDQAGFYRSSYVSADGSTRWLATTQFEQTDARHAFPCYDEPALRALFTIRITHGSTYHAISNMNIVSSEPAQTAGYHTTIFNETAQITPTYLLAFVVSDFEYKSQKNGAGFEQRVYARPNAIQDGVFGLDTGLKSLEAFENYFEIPFAFPKMDQAAIPDFSAGAMENWGLVTYREDYLLYNESRSTFANLRNIATVIAHEYAHQWFGNHVTPTWWTYLWLNEGFATLYENHGTDWLYPEWKILDTFVYAVVQNVMLSDATLATRPMTHYVEETADISRLFDNIAYAKSGSVLHMFLNAFTEKSFKRAIQNYLKLKANSDASEENLFAELEAVTKQDGTLDAQYNVQTIFSSWSRQSGFPIVSVQRNYANGAITLNQERYLAVTQTIQSPYLWYIPYNIATKSVSNFDETAATHWFSTRYTTINENTLKADDWLLLNKRMTGYYRVKYDPENYKLLSDALVQNLSQIHLTSRSQLIDDAFELARTERLDYGVALDFTKYLEHELEYVPWASAWRGLETVDRLYAGQAKYEEFSKYLVKQLAHLYNDAGLVAKANEHHYRKQARNQAIQWSCRLGSQKCLTETGQAVTEYVRTVGRVHIHQDHRATVLCNGIRNANEETYHTLINTLKTEVDQIERNRIIDALACTSNAQHYQLLLNTTIDVNSEFVRTASERYRAFSQVAAGNTHNSTVDTITFLTANIQAVYNLWGRSNINNAIRMLANYVVSDERNDTFILLLTEADTKDYIDEVTTTAARTHVEGNKHWIDHNAKVIEDWIEAYNGSAHVMASAILMAFLLVVSQLF